MNLLELGTIPFLNCREIQDALVADRIAGEIGDTVILCEHPPTITLGKNASKEDLRFPSSYYEERKIDIVQTDRGGGLTYHCPGQMMLYPVISLRDRKIGVKRFVAEMLQAIAAAISLPSSSAKLHILQDGILIEERKIVFCGLRIVRGVSNHGFSININCELENFKSFVPCRNEGLVVSSLEEEGCCLMMDKLVENL